MRVLLVEDDRKAAKLLAKGSQEEGFVVDVAATGEDGEEQATVNEYDVIVLDWLLPGKDGLAVCRALRARQLSTPILMLTAIKADSSPRARPGATLRDRPDRPRRHLRAAVHHLRRGRRRGARAGDGAVLAGPAASSRCRCVV